MKKLVILGASGSIGKQTIEVVRKHPEELQIVGLAVGNNVDLLLKLLNEFDVKYAYSIDRKPEFELLFPKVKFYYGDDGLIKLIKNEDYDTLVNALVGFSGLKPTIEGIKAKKDIALANKESLVVAGDIVKKLLKEYKVKLYPIDSEHSAIWQCIQGSNKKDIKRLIITGSGGAFRNLNRSELENVTLEQALNHPTWNMGAKITVDCATMMNKGFEIMEAHYLFNIDYDNIDVVLHNESIVHSMVEFNDNSVIAQMSTPDMRIPIQYALLYPSHDYSPHEESLDLTKISTLNFKELDYERYPLVKIAKDIGKFGGNIGAVINAANDTAVDLFIKGEIKFIEIENAVKYAIRCIPYIKDASIDDIYQIYDQTKDLIIRRYRNR